MDDKVKKIIIFTDGGSRGNPGPSAIGVVIKDGSGKTVKTYAETIGETTNNEAEYRALIFALQKIKSLFGKEKVKKSSLEIYMDSELIVNQLNGVYKIEEETLIPFFIKIWNLRIDCGGNIKIKHVDRAKNREADRLVNEALDNKSYLSSRLSSG